MSAARNIAAVVIGRNEGEALKASLRSAQATGMLTVYVDSGSSDGSPEVARHLGIAVVELDAKRPFSAARARNEGLGEVLRLRPGTEYVLFLDGDCVLQPGFAEAAAQTLADDGRIAIVTGHLGESFPDASIYNRLCEIEWHSPAGRIENFSALGGIMVARASAVRDVAGFNEQVIAGEDSELGVRLALADYSVVKIDRPMAIHDARMQRFSQWWTRAVRAGHALAQRYALNGRTRLRDCRRELLSTLFWGLAVPLAIVVPLWPTRGLSLLLLGGYALLGFRVYRYYRRSGMPADDAALATRFMIYAKFANLVGVLRFWLNSLRGRFHIIEYK